VIVTVTETIHINKNNSSFLNGKKYILLRNNNSLTYNYEDGITALYLCILSFIDAGGGNQKIDYATVILM